MIEQVTEPKECENVCALNEECEVWTLDTSKDKVSPEKRKR